MPFSKAWRSAIYPDFNDEGAYVDYKATKDILHRMKENIANPATPDELYNALLEQKLVVYKWCVNKQHELLNVASTLNEATRTLREDNNESSRSIMTGSLAHYGPKNKSKNKSRANNNNNNNNTTTNDNNNINKHNSNSSNYNDYSNNSSFSSSVHKNLTPHDARILADSVMHELLRFIECRNLNTDTIEHIIGRMYRYAVLGPTGDRWKNVYDMYDLYGISVDEILYHLSRVYDNVLQTEERMSAKSKARIPTGTEGSQLFDRKSIKYWVHMQDLPFVIARIIRHLPLSTFKDTYEESKRVNKPFTLYSPVSSVYYDNNKFLFYHRRLERREGSTLIRMRWYSDNFAEDWNALKPNDNVFMEIKVHHEAWSGERSTKRRFAVKEKDAAAYVHADLSLVPTLNKLRRKGASAQEQKDFKSLATEILTKIHCYELKPVLRTQCGRAAFQRGIDQTVRVSIDTHLRMSAEDFGMNHHWRYTGNDAPVMDFPYAVVEIKLQFAENEKMPPWIEELMECRYMESIPKFSKYAHGIAALYGHTNFISMVPYWMHQLDVDIRASTKPEQSRWDPTVGLASGCAERLADQLIFGASAAQTNTVGASEARFLTRYDYKSHYETMLRDMASGGGGGGSMRSTPAADERSRVRESGDVFVHATQRGSIRAGAEAKTSHAAAAAAAEEKKEAEENADAERLKTATDAAVTTSPAVLPTNSHTNSKNVDEKHTNGHHEETHPVIPDDVSHRDDKEAAAANHWTRTPPLPAMAAMHTTPAFAPERSIPAPLLLLPAAATPSTAASSSSLPPMQLPQTLSSITPPLHTDRRAPLTVVQYSVDRRHDAYTTFHLYPYTETGVESVCFHPKQHSRHASAEVFFGTIPWQTGKRIRVPQKYDPKTLLTSERYMAKWMQLATQIGLFGLMMIRFGNGLFLPQAGSRLMRSSLSHTNARATTVSSSSASSRWLYQLSSMLWRPRFHVVTGLMMVGVALMTLLYAYVAFQARARRVYARRKIRYDDVLGPTWMTFFMIVGFCLLVSMHIVQRYSPMLTGDDNF